MKQCSVYCINTGKDATADILQQTSKQMKVAIVGTNLTIILSRKDTRQPYVGRIANMEFETFGELE